MPVEILGLNEVPEAGDDYIAVDNEKLAKQVACLLYTSRCV